MSMELNKESVEQAGGDERAGFEAWLAQAMSHHFDPEFDLAKYEDSGEYRYNPATDYWKAWQARAALAQPSPAPVCTTPTGENCPGDGVKSCKKCPEQPEAERPEVVAVVRAQGFGRVCEAIDANTLYQHCSEGEPLMTVTQHDRIVGALRAVITQLRQHKSDYMDAGQETYRALQNEIREREAEIARLDGLVSGRTAERDAALARVAELERQEPVATVAKVPGEDWNSLDFHRDLQDMQPGTKLYAAPVAQAQHSVPETTNEEANSFLRVADAGQFKDNAAAVRTAAMIIRGLLHSPAIMKSIIRHRIGLTPEYEGQWHADLYGEDGEVQHHAEADTPDEAVRAVVALAAAPGKEVGHE
ncbi:hypothetical protein N1H70_000043 [Pseudomonas aeruginosa]|nr:hypothetical protein [Pseudomonas aeruginosa]